MISMQDDKYRYMIDVASHGAETAEKLWSRDDSQELVSRKEGAPFQPLLNWHVVPKDTRFLSVSESGQIYWAYWLDEVPDHETLHSKPSDEWLKLTYHVFQAFKEDVEAEGRPVLEDNNVEKTSEEEEGLIEETLGWPTGLRGVEALDHLVVPAMKENPEDWYKEFEVFVETTPIPYQVRRFVNSKGVFNAISEGKRVRRVKPEYRKVQLIDGRVISWPKPITVEPYPSEKVWTLGLVTGKGFRVTYIASHANQRMFQRGLLFNSKEKADQAGRAFHEFIKTAT